MRIVYDIGGTSFRFAKFVDDTLIEQGKMQTPTYVQGLSEEGINHALLEQIASAVGNDQSEINEIGICYAGPVSEDGAILGSPTIHGKKLETPFNLKEAIQSLTGIRTVHVINDLSAAAFRYLDDYRSFEIITVSTGIGNKIVINGNLQIGSEGFEGELGHLPACIPAPFNQEVNLDCPCGFGKNHLGEISSGRGIVNVAEQLKEGSLRKAYELSLLNNFHEQPSLKSALKTSSQPKNSVFTAKAITSACEQDDQFAQQVIDVCTYPLAYAICLTLTSLYLEKIILTGSVVLNSSAYYESLMKNILKIGVYNYTNDHLAQKIVKGFPDDDSGLIGMNKFLQQK